MVIHKIQNSLKGYKIRDPHLIYQSGFVFCTCCSFNLEHLLNMLTTAPNMLKKKGLCYRLVCLPCSTRRTDLVSWQHAVTKKKYKQGKNRGRAMHKWTFEMRVCCFRPGSPESQSKVDTGTVVFEERRFHMEIAHDIYTIHHIHWVWQKTAQQTLAVSIRFVRGQCWACNCLLLM